MDAPTSHGSESAFAQLHERVAQLEQDLAAQKWIEEALKTLASGTAATTGKEFLQALVRQLSLALNIRYAFVTEWVPGRTDRLRTVAGWSGNCAADPLEIDLHDFPCQQVMKDGTVFFAQGIRQAFPRNTLLSSIGVESYMGVVLRNSEGQPTGHLCAMDVQPFVFDESQGISILNSFAQRAAAELEGLRAERALKTSDQRYQFLYENNPSMYFTLAQEGTVLAVNHYGADQLGYSQEELTGQSILRLFDAHDHQTVLEQLSICASNPTKLFHWEIEKIRKSGTRLWVREHARAIQDETGTIVILVVCEDIAAHKQVELSLGVNEQSIRSLQAVSSSPGLTFEQRMQAVLELGCRRFGLPIGAFTKVIGDRLELRQVWPPTDGFPPGTQIPLCQSFCSVTLQTEGTLCFEHAGSSDWRHHPAYSALGLESYIGTKLSTHGKTHGSICFFGSAPYAGTFSTADKEFLLLMARWISVELDRQQDELRLQRINECFLGFGSDPLANINRLTALGGELLGGTCALYSRLEGALLCSIGQWQTPSDFNPVDQADGHLCSDLINRGDEHLCTVRHLADTSYVRTDPNVSRYRLQTYVGQIVTRGQDPIGSLCVVFQHDFVPTAADERLMSILAAAIETEEERMRTQKALEASETQWRQFVEDAPVGLVILDTDQRLINANRAFCAMTGYSEREVIGNTYALYTHPDDLPDNLKLTQDFFAGTRSGYTYEKRYIRKTGDIIWVAVTTTGIELQGHAGPLLLAVVEDISERKRVTEERERISQDLHDDVLQSLYAVGMGLEHVRHRLDRITPTNARRLDSSVAQLNAVIREVRSFIPRMQTPPVQEGTFDQALLAIVESLTASGAGNIDVKIDESAVEPLLRPQYGPMLSIAKEALSNSLRHAGAAHRTVTVQLYRGKIRLEISDDGKGFSSTARQSAGMGLGNMRARARKLGARLTIRSQPGKGTHVVLDIPPPAQQGIA